MRLLISENQLFYLLQYGRKILFSALLIDTHIDRGKITKLLFFFGCAYEQQQFNNFFDNHTKIYFLVIIFLCHNHLLSNNAPLCKIDGIQSVI